MFAIINTAFERLYTNIENLILNPNQMISAIFMEQLLIIA